MVDKNAIDKMVARFLDTFYWTREQTAGWVRSNFIERLRYENEVVKLTGDQTIEGVKTFEDDIIAGVVRRANETSTLYLMGGTSTTQGPYIVLAGKDVGGANDGDIVYVSSIESSATGNHIWYKYTGSAHSELMRLTADGDLILSDAGLQYLRLNNTSGTLALCAATTTTDGPYIALVGKDQGASEDGTVQIVGTTESSALGDIIFFIYDGSNFNEKARIRASDSLLLIPGGINFGEQTLMNYKHSSWTPTLTASTPGTLSTGYNVRTGRYTRIGNVVYYVLFMRTSGYSAGTASGEINITGLPFTASLTEQNLAPAPVSTAGITFPGTPIGTMAEVPAGSSMVRLFGNQSGGGKQYVGPSHVSAASDISVAGFYFV